MINTKNQNEIILNGSYDMHAVNSEDVRYKA